jgi:hypothetical protein
MSRLLRKNAGSALRSSPNYPAAGPPNGAKAAALQNYLQKSALLTVWQKESIDF